MLVLSLFREIKETIGRYIAILLIIGLGVGFFAGLKVTDPAMRISMLDYFKQTQFYDFRLISTLGFEEEDIDYIRDNVDARAVEGSISFDAIVETKDGNQVLKAISLPEDINKIILESGRLPEKSDECVVDSDIYEEDAIGKTIIISRANELEDRDHFSHNMYKIVGLAKTPLYIQYERGTTSLGAGVLDGFMYIPEAGFDVDFYTDCYVKLDSDLELYSDEYKNLIESKEDDVESVLNKASDNRYNRILADATAELNDARAELEDKKAEGQEELDNAKAELDKAKKQLDDARKTINDLENQKAELKSALDMMLLNLNEATQPVYQQYSADYYTLEAGLDKAYKEYDKGVKEYEDGLAEYNDGKAEFDEKIANAQVKIDDAQAQIDDIEEASTYVLGRDSNVGYVCFESDSTIVGAIANVFPVFFFLVAALVCMTTMNRMVEDQRTQIGVLKALGYSNGAIMGKFVFYAGSAALIGSTLGFVVGTIVFPKAIWFAYTMMYNTQDISYYFSTSMLAISFVVAFICSVGVTMLSCRYEMAEMAASLMRPKAPKAGKRIFLEYIPVFWNRLKFLQKVSLRNIFRYKGRLFMMVLGIGGCTALLVAGLGIYDSIAEIAVNQYTNISLYDMDMTLKNGTEGSVEALEELGYSTEDYLLYYHTSVDMKAGKNTKNIYLDVFDKDADIDSFYDMHTSKGEHIVFADLKDNETIINEGLADRNGIKVGDTIEISSDSISPTKLTVAAINQNFIYNYIYLTDEGYEAAIGEVPGRKNLYLNIKDGEDAHSVGATIMDNKDVSMVNVAEDMLKRIANMMKSLNIIVYLVIGCAMALATVVVYNLTNINIAERVREIATVKVLGFYREETRSYVFRENIILSIMGAAVGQVLGKFLHAFVMSEIVIDLITFDVRVTSLSYCLSFVLTVLFTLIINFLMGHKLDEISMTESLKAIE